MKDKILTYLTFKGFILHELRKLRQDDVIEEILDFEWEINENGVGDEKLTDDLLVKEDKNATVDLDLECDAAKEIKSRHKLDEKQLDLKRKDSPLCYYIRKLRQDEDISMEILDYEWEGDGLAEGLGEADGEIMLIN